MKTIRERIQDYQEEILRGDLPPTRAAEILTEISALLGSCNEEITKRDMEYNKILLEWYDKETTANRAKIRANTTPEYEAMRTARNIKELAIELIRSLKFFLKAKEDEFKSGKYQ